MRKLLCKIGLHTWIYSKKPSLTDIYPSPFSTYEAPKRTCKRCSKKQVWLPGYGGSEPGSWEP